MEASPVDHLVKNGTISASKLLRVNYNTIAKAAVVSE